MLLLLDLLGLLSVCCSRFSAPGSRLSELLLSDRPLTRGFVPCLLGGEGDSVAAPFVSKGLLSGSSATYELAFRGAGVGSRCLL